MKSKVLKPRSRTSWFSHSRSSLAVWEEKRRTSGYLRAPQNENPRFAQHRTRVELNSSYAKTRSRSSAQIKIPPSPVPLPSAHEHQHHN